MLYRLSISLDVCEGFWKLFDFSFKTRDMTYILNTNNKKKKLRISEKYFNHFNTSSAILADYRLKPFDF